MLSIEILLDVNKLREQSLQDIFVALSQEDVSSNDVQIATTYLSLSEVYNKLNNNEYLLLLRILEKMNNTDLNILVKKDILDKDIIKSLLLSRRINYSSLSSKAIEDCGFYIVYVVNDTLESSIEDIIFYQLEKVFSEDNVGELIYSVTFGNNQQIVVDRIVRYLNKHAHNMIETKLFPNINVPRNNRNQNNSNMNTLLSIDIDYSELYKNKLINPRLISTFSRHIRNVPEEIKKDLVDNPMYLEYLKNKIYVLPKEQDRDVINRSESERIAELLSPTQHDIKKFFIGVPQKTLIYTSFRDSQLILKIYGKPSIDDFDYLYTKDLTYYPMALVTQNLYSFYNYSKNEQSYIDRLDKLNDGLDKLLKNSNLYFDLNFLEYVSDIDKVYKFLMKLDISVHILNFSFILRNKELQTKELFEKYKDNITYSSTMVYNKKPVFSEDFGISEELGRTLGMLFIQ